MSNCILMGHRTGEYLTRQKDVIIIGDNIPIAKDGEMIIGDTVGGVPIPEDFKKAIEQAGAENARHIISFCMQVVDESHRRAYNAELNRNSRRR